MVSFCDKKGQIQRILQPSNFVNDPANACVRIDERNAISLACRCIGSLKSFFFFLLGSTRVRCTYPSSPSRTERRENVFSSVQEYLCAEIESMMARRRTILKIQRRLRVASRLLNSHIDRIAWRRLRIEIRVPRMGTRCVDKATN